MKPGTKADENDRLLAGTLPHDPDSDAAEMLPGGVPKTSLPPEHSFPKLEAEAYYGPLGEVARLVEPCTEADSATILLHLLVAFGCVVGRGPKLVMGSIRQHANLFAVVVGRSAKARKGTAWGIAKQIIAPADQAWAEARVKSGLSSGEGVIQAVRDPVIAKEPIREGGKRTGRVIEYQEVETDPGEADKRFLIVESEFARALKVASRKENILSPILREAWDSGNLNIMTKSPCRATGAHICIVGHITGDELRRELSACDSVNGYANRFLWWWSYRARLLPFGGSSIEDVTAGTVSRLGGAAMWAKARGDLVVSMSTAAKQKWGQVYPQLSCERQGLVGSILARAEAQVLRIALVYALADESNTVESCHLDAALAFWRFSEKSARFIFGNALGDPVADEILRLLRESPEGVTREEIGDHFHRHTPAPRLTEALRILQESRLAHAEKRPPRGGTGRPAERWFAVTEGSEESAGSGESQESAPGQGGSLANLANRAGPGPGNTGKGPGNGGSL